MPVDGPAFICRIRRRSRWLGVDGPEYRPRPRSLLFVSQQQGCDGRRREKDFLAKPLQNCSKTGDFLRQKTKSSVGKAISGTVRCNMGAMAT
jgi:hypothetical protein